MTRQARNLSWHLEDEGIKLSLVIHDHDRKFPGSFDRVFEFDGAQVVVTPLLTPRANAHTERWIGSCRRECLDSMLVASEGHLSAVLREYREHYNHERHHRSRDLRPPWPRGDPIPHQRGNTINEPASATRRSTARHTQWS